MTYAEIVEKLQLPKFIGEDEHYKAILQRLDSAGIVFSRRGRKREKTIDYMKRSDIFAVNNCLHMAASIVILGSNPQILAGVLQDVKKTYPSMDPTTIITISALYYSVAKLKNSAQDSQKKLEAVHRRFDEMKWFVGDRMFALGISIARARK